MGIAWGEAGPGVMSAAVEWMLVLAWCWAVQMEGLSCALAVMRTCTVIKLDWLCGITVCTTRNMKHGHSCCMDACMHASSNGMCELCDAWQPQDAGSICTHCLIRICQYSAASTQHDAECTKPYSGL